MEKDNLENLGQDWWVPAYIPPGNRRNIWGAFNRTWLRTIICALLFLFFLSIREVNWAPAQKARSGLKYALTARWDYRPILSQMAGYGLTVVQNWAPVKNLMADDSRQAVSPATEQWVAPVQGKVIKPYGWVKSQLDGMQRFSPGVDIAVSAGTKVKACLAGKVAKKGYDSRYGNYVLLDHGEGTYTFYGQLYQIDVKTGEMVGTGQVLGEVAPVTDGQPFLHFEVREKDKLVDPQTKVNLSS